MWRKVCTIFKANRQPSCPLPRLLASPYLTDLRYLRFERQSRLTTRAFRQIVSALPALSFLDVASDTLTCWLEPELARTLASERGESDLRVTPKLAIQRPEDWVVELEREVGYIACAHPEEHYGSYRPRFEAVIEHPLDAAIIARRGETVAEPGPKPSLALRRAAGSCAICGSAQLEFRNGAGDLWSDPTGYYSGTWLCHQCEAEWKPWPQKMP